MKKHRILIIASTIVIIVLTIFILWHKYYIFSSDKWINCKNDSLRILMLKNMEEKNDIIGMSSNEILNLLGEPVAELDNLQTMYTDFANEGADKYWYYRVNDNSLAGWEIYLIGFKNDIVVGKKVTIEDW